MFVRNWCKAKTFLLEFYIIMLCYLLTSLCATFHCRVGLRRWCPLRRWLGAWCLDGLSCGWWFRAAALPLWGLSFLFQRYITFASIYLLAIILLAPTWWWDPAIFVFELYTFGWILLGDFWGEISAFTVEGELFCIG